jgi:hypothetical protein
VPKERAGIATGIFSTTRVAGEGIALAIVGAVLATFAHGDLRRLAPGMSGTSGATLRAAARLATGDLAGAAAVLPGVDRAALLASYTHAFDRLLIGLAVVTVLCAGVVFAFLGARPAVAQGRGDEGEPAHGEAPVRRRSEPACADANGR